MVKFYDDVYEKFYSLTSLQDLLNKYCKDVKNKIYTTRITYDIWKKLNSITEKDNVNVYFHTNNVCICIHLDWYWEEEYSQNGFAHFLLNEIYNEYNNKGEEKRLMENSSYLDGYICAADLAAAPLTMSAESATDAAKAWSSYTTNISSLNKAININDEIYSLQTEVNNLKVRLDTKVDKIPTENISNKMEDNKMKGFNFDFGSFKNTDTVGLSLYGIAVYNYNNEWVSYDPSTGDIINVDLMNIENGNKYIYKMPVAVKDVKPGDVIIHHSLPVFVNAVNEDGTFVIIDVAANESKCILPTKSMFGFNFVTKVISLFDFNPASASPDQPFGNMLPLLMMNSDAKDSSDNMLMAMMMAQNGDMDFSKNPMMMYFLMKDNSEIDPLALMMLTNCGKLNK